MSGLNRFGRVLPTCVVVLSLLAGTAMAGPVFSDVTISGSLTYDTANSFNDTGTMALTSGESGSTSGFSDGSAAGSNPLSGNITNIGDGLGISSSFAVGDPDEFFSAVDLAFSMTNTNATDTYRVRFRVTNANLATSSGADSYSISEFFLDQPSGTEVFFSGVVSDTVFGNEINGSATGGFGGNVTDSGVTTIDVILAPGASATLVGAWEAEGGVYDGTAGTEAAGLTFSSFVEVAQVRNLNNPVPEPTTMALFGLGLLGLVGYRIRRRKRS